MIKFSNRKVYMMKHDRRNKMERKIFEFDVGIMGKLI